MGGIELLKQMIEALRETEKRLEKRQDEINTILFEIKKNQRDHTKDIKDLSERITKVQLNDLTFCENCESKRSITDLWNAINALVTRIDDFWEGLILVRVAISKPATFIGIIAGTVFGMQLVFQGVLNFYKSRSVDVNTEYRIEQQKIESKIESKKNTDLKKEIESMNKK